MTLYSCLSAKSDTWSASSSICNKFITYITLMVKPYIYIYIHNIYYRCIYRTLGNFIFIMKCNEDGPIQTSTAVHQHPNIPKESDGCDDDGPIPQHPNIHTQDTRNCELCHEVYSSEDLVLILPCKHFFHSNCVLR